MKIFKGKVISKKMAKTATVEVTRVVVHPLYKKRYKKTRKYHVHDELDTNIGDNVKFIACKPYSKLKKWKVTEVLKDANSSSKTKKSVTISKKKGSKK